MPTRLAVLLLFSLLCQPLKAEEILRLLTWPGYADSDLVRAFEQRYGVEVEVTFVGSDDELRHKLAEEHGKHYDVIAANTSEISYFTEQNLLQPLRLNNLPNRSRQLRQFRELREIPGLTRDDKTYGIPYTYGEMGLIYNRQLLQTAPDSLSSLWDPALQGRVLAYDGSSHNFSLARMVLNQPPFAIAPEELPQTLSKLVDLRRNVLTFYSLPEDSVTLFKQNEIALIYANYGRQQLKLLQDAGADVAYVIPREGALAWLDCWAVSRGAVSQDLAERWINYTLEPQVSNALTERQGLSNTLGPIDANSASSNLIWLEPVENAEQRNQLWQRILAGERPEELMQP